MSSRDMWLSGGWAVLVFLGVLIFLVPPMRARGAIEREIEGLEVELAKPMDGPETIERLTNDLAALREFGEGRMTPIPEESDVAGLMSSISQTLSTLKIDRRDITTRATKEYEEARAVPLTAALTGPFMNIYEAIGAIESLPRLVRVERLRIATAEEDPGAASRSGEVRAELSIEAFFTGARAPVEGAAEGGGR
ncbi:MAG: type 4a pilus biogenesis protein PilO [Planctomycetota bacterium]|nr:type 4a pilus biogenesis protein PilO [Planctomycetota bacterium]